MKKIILIMLFFSLGIISLHSHCSKNLSNKNVFPIQFSLSETKIVNKIPEKSSDFAFIIPGNPRTYIYNDETEYYKDYQRSYFALTSKKGGWDCMRHYEILANGCIPYFINIDQCNPNTMYFLPKQLIKEAMSLEGVSYLKIDHTKFDKAKYYEILHKLLEHTRAYLTTKNMAAYILKTINYSGNGNILFLSHVSCEDYLLCSVLIGLKQNFGNKIVDFPKIDCIYDSYSGDTKRLYGKGFTYSKTIEDIPVDRSNIEQRIKNKEFDLIVYSYVHRGLPFHELVCKTYEQKDIIYMCGEDAHQCKLTYLNNLFLREFDGA